MRTLFTPLCLGAVLALPLTAMAASPAGDDPVAASFARMLEHPPVTGAPVAPSGRENDPLQRHLAAVLWDRQPGHCGPAHADIGTVALRAAH